MRSTVPQEAERLLAGVKQRQAQETSCSQSIPRVGQTKRRSPVPGRSHREVSTITLLATSIVLGNRLEPCNSSSTAFRMPIRQPSHPFRPVTNSPLVAEHFTSRSLASTTSVSLPTSPSMIPRSAESRSVALMGVDVRAIGRAIPRPTPMLPATRVSVVASAVPCPPAI